MPVLPIYTIPNPILRQRAKKVARFDDDLKKITQAMTDTMRHYFGVGLAAPQLGLSWRIIAVEYHPTPDMKKLYLGEKPFDLKILINPQITKFSKEQVDMDEGCLSLPNLELPVRRPKEINVLAQDINGQKIKIRAKGLLSRVIQHESDHLDGILFTDRAKGRNNLKSYRSLRVVFMGTPAFALPTLEALKTHEMPVVGVITEPDKPVGREKIITPTAVKILAGEYGLPIYQPENNEDLVKILKEISPDYLVVAAYGRILPVDVLKIPPYGGLNIHPSLLPKYRGASPIQAAILAGDKETGVTIMRMDEKMDHGPIVAQTTMEIKDDDTAESLKERLAIEGANLLIKALPGYLGNQKQPQEQDHQKATYIKMIKKEDGLIDWRKPAEMIERQIRAYYPWPKAYTMIKQREKRKEKKEGQRLIIHKAHLENSKLVPDLVQLEGKKAVSWADFKRGFKGELPKELK